MWASFRAIVTGILLIAMAAMPAAAQKTTDNQFRHPVANPSYPPGSGPIVCVDEGHQNHHTIEGSFAPFATLLRDDGYEVLRTIGPFTADPLSKCDIMVIANPLLPVDQEKEGQYPHDSAFTEEELNRLLGWLRDGGALLLIVDHTPWAGAAGGLMALLGIQVFDGQVRETALFGQMDEEAHQHAANAAGVSADVLRERVGSPGERGVHPIIEGRSPPERVASVWTFNGSALYPSSNVEPLLTLGPDATGITALVLNWPMKPHEDGSLILERPEVPAETIPATERDELNRLLMPRFAMGGWLHGAAVSFGSGRAVVLADGAMCTAQFFGTNKMGMNTPIASDNPQFCLNAMHWLSGLLSG